MIDLSGAALLASWKDAQQRGLKQKEHAKMLGMPYSTYTSRMQRAASNTIIVPESRYAKLDGAPVLEGDWLVMCDLHAPYHHAEFVNYCIAVAAKRGVKNLLLAGDAIDNESLSHWPEEIGAGAATLSSTAEARLLSLTAQMSTRDANKLLAAVMDMGRPERDLSEEMLEARKVFKALGGSFDRIVQIAGNHETRIIRALEKTMSAEDIAILFGMNGEKWEQSPYFYADIISNGERVHVTHPHNSGKGSSKKIVSQYMCHVIMAHNHHFSVQSDPSGRFLAIEPGMCADPQRISFESIRDRSTDKHIVGSVIVQGGHFLLLNQWTDFVSLLA